MTNKLSYIVLYIMTIIIMLPINSYSQDGSLDSTFGTDGFVTTFVGTSNSEGRAVAIQNDGKIIVAGASVGNVYFDFTLIRYNTDGSLDSTFDHDGIVITDVSFSGDEGLSIALQSDGKIVVVGYSSGGFGIVRYNINGSLDSSFNNSGIVSMGFLGAMSSGNSVALQNDGKIVVAGWVDNATTSVILVTRLNTNGSRDSTFDNDGLVFTDFGTSNARGAKVAIQYDGKIIVTGRYYNFVDKNFATVRYNINGSLDSSFNFDGKVITDLGGIEAVGEAIALQDNGKIIVAGWSIDSSHDLAVIRYNIDGSLDTTFDFDGKLTTDISNSEDMAFSVVIQKDGKIIVVGDSSANVYPAFALVRYNSNGSLDTTFNNDGRVTSIIEKDADAFSVSLQNDGKIVVAGRTYANGKSGFVVARYKGNSIEEPIPQDEENVIFFPNVFTPNNDLLNDEFKGIVLPKYLLETYTLSIFNRWGNLVYSTHDITSGWNGKFSNQDASIGTYFYLAEFKLKNQSKKYLKGDFMLLR